MEWGRAESLEHWCVPKIFLVEEFCWPLCVSHCHYSFWRWGYVYQKKKKNWLTKIFFRVFCTLIILFLIQKLKSLDLPAMFLKFCSALLMQTDKFFLGQIGIHEGTLSLTCQSSLSYRSLPCSMEQDRAATPLTWLQYRVRQISLLRDLSILNQNCFPLPCSELAQAFSISLLRDSSLINHSIWQEQVFTSWLVSSAQSQMRWVFFHSSDVWLCEKRIRVCSGKICQPSSLRHKLLGWGSSSWLCPPGTEPLLRDPRRDLWAMILQSLGKNHFSVIPSFEWHFQERSLWKT